MLPRRTLTPEFMDDPNADRAELAQSLRFIRMVNARLGGRAAALWHFKRWAGDWPSNAAIRILDIGTGSADIPLAIAKWAERNHHRVQITAVDLHPLTVSLAREFIGARNDIQIVQADALKLMDHFQSGEFDYAHAGMFLHHLPDIDVMTVLRIMDRLTKRGLIWNDLVRGWPGRVGVQLLTLGTPKMVRHDGVVSVHAAFTRAEAIELAQRAGLGKIQYRKHLLHRFTLVSSKPPT